MSNQQISATIESADSKDTAPRDQTLAAAPTPNADRLTPSDNTQYPILNTPAADAVASLERLIKMASGDIYQEVIEGTHIFYRAPDLRSVIYLINRAIGTPNVRVVSENTAVQVGNQIEIAYEKVLRGLKNLGKGEDPLSPEGPFAAAISEQSAHDVQCMQQMADIEKRVIEFLPTAISRLKEICAGVIIRKELEEGSDRTYNLTPNRRAIRYLASRIDGASYAIVSEILTREREAAEEPRKLTKEETASMSRLACIPYWNARNQYEYEQRIKEKAKTLRGPASPLAHVAAAYKQMADYLPIAIEKMAMLAEGAVTLLEYGGVSREIKHAPDVTANQFLLNRFAGAPASCLPIRSEVTVANIPNKEWLADRTANIMKLCKKHKELSTEKVTQMLNHIAGKQHLRLSLYAQ